MVDIAVLETVAEMHESSSLSLGTLLNCFEKAKESKPILKNKTDIRPLELRSYYALCIVMWCVRSCDFGLSFAVFLSWLFGGKITRQNYT